MRVRLLGPVDVAGDDGGVRPVPGRRRKAVLAALALHPGQTVGTDRLVDVVWDDRPSAAAATTLQSHVSHLRGVLGDRSAITADPPGYRLELGPEPTDVRVAERLIEQGTRATDPAVAARHFRSALALWRGRPLAGLAGLAWFDGQAERLDRWRRQARHALADSRLALGEHVQLVPELSEAAAADPHDERAYAQLMIALYRAGRQSDALAAYHRIRRALDEELGLRPGAALRDLEAAILRQDPTLDLTPAFRQGPAQLPLAPAGFTGRVAEIAELDTMSQVCAVTGTAGVGKTALAVHWAHRVAARFPDGQLYVNLRGFDPGGPALDPADVLRGFLGALDVTGGRIPAGTADRAALYRSLLAGRRMLVLLDNARDAEQVRPLLPGSPGCLTVVTSRDRLTGLVAAEGARPVRLGLLSEAEAGALLARRLGAARTAGEPDAVAEVVARCARLPLALAIAAARAAGNTAFPLSALAAELRGAANGLDALDSGDAATDIRSVFSWSLRAVSADAARLFRLLGLHPGPHIAAPAAAGLVALPAARARALLAELARAHLVTEDAPGRYALHDLLRAYAEELSLSEDAEAATDRLLDHYLHTAHAAAGLLADTRETITLEPARPGVVPEAPDDTGAALSWFGAEHPALAAAVARAADTGRDAMAWRLAWAFSTYLLRQGHWREQMAVLATAIDAATRLDRPAWAAESLHALARTHTRLGDHEHAEQHFEQAFTLCETAGDLSGQAHNLGGLAEVAEQLGRPADVLRHNLRALEVFRQLDDQVNVANTLNGIGWGHHLLGDHEQGLAACMEAIELAREVDELGCQAAAWDSVACIRRALGDLPGALAGHRNSVDMCRRIGERYWEACSLANLGDTYEAAGDSGGAAGARREALAIFEEMAHPEASAMRAKLEGQPGSADREDQPGPADREDQPGSADREDQPGSADREDQPGS